jgi:ribosome maturation factor RimP
MQTASAEIWNLILPVIEGLDYEFVGAQFGQTESGNTLRVFIDHENGIGVDDCAKVSEQLSAVLDVEEPISGRYVLEVSSPGLDRPLFDEDDFSRFVGQTVKVKTAVPQLGRRRFKGPLREVRDGVAVVEVDGEPYELPIHDIDEANIVPVF